MTQPPILGAIAAERALQRTLYSEQHDDSHSLSVWIAIFVKLLGDASANGNPDSASHVRFKRQVIRLAATAMAAAEAIDRRAPLSDKVRTQQLAQDLADQWQEPVLVLPAGRKHIGATGTTTVEKTACCVLLSQAEPQEIGQQVMRVEPQRKEETS